MSAGEEDLRGGPEAGRVVLVTAPSREAALDLARTLVGEELIACANLVEAVTSVYRWKGRVEESPEALLILKTVRGRLGALEERVLELHPYDLPEFVVLEPEAIEPRYAAWLAQSVLDGGEA